MLVGPCREKYDGGGFHKKKDWPEALLGLQGYLQRQAPRTPSKHHPAKTKLNLAVAVSSIHLLLARGGFANTDLAVDLHKLQHTIRSGLRDMQGSSKQD